MSKKLKKYIPLILIIIIFSTLSYITGVYSFYYKIFPFNPSSKIKPEKNLISSAFYDFEIKKYNLPILGKYGGIENFDNKILFVSGDGQSYFFDEKKIQFKKLKKFNLQTNKDKFVKKYEKDFGKLKLQRRFGIKDIHINDFQNNKYLFLSSIFYNVENDCYNLSVYSSNIISVKNSKFDEPKKFFETKKCLKIENNEPTSTNYKLGRNFAPTSASGRIEKFDENHILLTVGDFLYDGVNSENLVQDLDNDYGKILKININDYTYKIFSLGHRNPQGLTVLNKTNIFSTEHGPYGGDEFNKIIENSNYGWPYYTFGTDYGKKIWPLNNKKKLKDTIKPILSWTPSIAVSNLIFYNSNYLSKWKNNFIISTLKDKSLHRITVSKNFDKVLNVERIFLNYRMRDILVNNEGKIVILTDTKTNNEIPKILIIEKK